MGTEYWGWWSTTVMLNDGAVTKAYCFWHFLWPNASKPSVKTHFPALDPEICRLWFFKFLFQILYKCIFIEAFFLHPALFQPVNSRSLSMTEWFVFHSSLPILLSANFGYMFPKTSPIPRNCLRRVNSNKYIYLHWEQECAAFGYPKIVAETIFYFSKTLPIKHFRLFTLKSFNSVHFADTTDKMWSLKQRQHQCHGIIVTLKK